MRRRPPADAAIAQFLSAIPDAVGIRDRDQTQPYYYFGAVRAYPRFWCDAIE